MPGHDMIVIGASAGGVEALKALVAAFPKDLPAAVLLVLHVSPESPSVLASILGHASSIPVRQAKDKLPIEPGRVYVARPDCHLLIEPNQMRVVRGPRENRHRPAIDVLFRSAAWSYGPRVAAVILSGTLDDGTAGLWAVKYCGGVCIVQDPADAMYGEMPRNAMNAVEVDHCLPLRDIPPLLVDLAHQAARSPGRPPPQRMKTEIEFAMIEHDIRDMGGLGVPTAFTCPNCQGALWELNDGDLLRFRCHVGHAFSSESLLAEQTVALEEALNSAVRALEEKSAVLRRMADRYFERHPEWSQGYHDKARQLEESADALRAVLNQSAL